VPDKRYQVFISSTFRDLQDERQAVLKAVLELDHMPAGMELFPASDEAAWGLIQNVIDESDYYVLIIGGRYGSLHKEGLGYTEMEYDYAISRKKAVIPLLHMNPDNLPRGNTETEPESWEKLKQFRAKVEASHTCNYWELTDDLKSKVIVGLTAIMKKRPAVGWVRADQVPSGARVEEVLALRDTVAALQAQLSRARMEAPIGTEDLSQGADPFHFTFNYVGNAQEDGEFYQAKFTDSAHPTWNELFSSVAPTLLHEARDVEVRNSIRKFLLGSALQAASNDMNFEQVRPREFSVADHFVDTCVVQLRALGLIAESQKRRSVTDTQKYWALTPYGDNLMVQLRALRRPLM
jgi:hypothetical protein